MKKKSKPISLYSNWWIKPGHEKKVAPLLKKLAKKVEKEEPGTLMYLVHFPINDFTNSLGFVSEPVTRPGAVTFVETYASWQAFKDHVEGPIFTGFVKKYGHHFVQAAVKKGEDPKPFTQVVFMDKVAGFLEKKKK